METISTCNLHMQRNSHMHTAKGLLFRVVGRMTAEERELRWRLRRWLLYFRDRYMEAHPDATAKDFANEVDISESHLSNIQNARETDRNPRLPGLDVALKMHRKYGRDMHRLLMEEPSGSSPPTEKKHEDPAAAPSSPARPRGHRTGGGGR